MQKSTMSFRILLAVAAVFCMGSPGFLTEGRIVAHPRLADLPGSVTTVSVVSETHVSSLGEGPYWDEKNQLLYHVDSVGSAFYQVNPNTGEVQKRTVPDAVVSIIIPYQNEEGKFIISRGNTLLKLDWATGETELLVELDANPGGYERFNDGKCDAQGRLFIGTVLELEGGGGVVPEGGSLYRLDFDSATSTHSFTKMATGFSISNGMSWSNNGATKFYLDDSEGCKVYSFDYDISTGSLTNQQLLIDCVTHPDILPGEVPDGQAIDRYGFLWIAMWNGGRVIKVNPQTAEIIDSIPLPRNQIPTSLAFGDYQGQFGFYLTTANVGLPEVADDGKLLHINIIGGEVGGFIPA